MKSTRLNSLSHEQRNKKSELQIKNSNLTRANSGFLSLNPEEYCSTLEKTMKVSDNSEFYDKSIVTNSNSSPEFFLDGTKKKLNLKSCVLSPKLSIEAKIESPRKEEIENISEFDEKKSNFLEDPLDISQDVISRNGWMNKISSLQLRPEEVLKQSFCDGVEEESPLNEVKLKKLHKMGRDLTQSIIPVEESFSEDF